MIETILTGLIISIITEISKKTNISQSSLIAGLCFLVGIGYTIINYYNPNILIMAVKFTLQSLGVANAVYMAYTKITK